MPNPENLKNFKHGFDPRRHLTGRAKKYETTLKEMGYKKSEVVDAINVLISLDEPALKEVAENEDSTALEKIVALSLLQSIKKKTPYNIDLFLTRVYGQPKQEIEAEIKGDITITFNLDDNIPNNPAT